MFRIVEPLGGRFTAPAAGGGGAAAFNPASVTGYSRDWNFADITKIYTDTAGTILATADGDPIGAVLCSAGSTIKLVAAADAARPTYETGIQNGLSVGRFDASDDGLSGAIDADASTTIYLVVQKRSAVPASSITALSFNTVNAQVYVNSGAPSAGGFNYFSTAAAAQAAIGGTATSWTILCLRFTSAADLKLYANGGAPGSSIDPQNDYNVATQLNLGFCTAAAPQRGDYDIGRLLVYSAAHTTTEMDIVLSGLGALWGISVTATS
jgi:hypothetical protein